MLINYNYRINSCFLSLVSASQKYRKSILSCICILYVTVVEKVSYMLLRYFFMKYLICTLYTF